MSDRPNIIFLFSDQQRWDTLEKLGLAENTLVIYTSDHGSHFKTRNGEYKRPCYDGCIRIPFLMHGPGFEGGRKPAGLVSLIDAPTTILRAAAITPPPEMKVRTCGHG